MRRRNVLRGMGLATLALPFVELLAGKQSRADGGVAKRIIFFYFPDGVVGPSQDGDPSRWHCSGSEHNFQLGELLAPLSDFRDDCLFFNGLTMGPTDSGSHPGGAQKLLTAADHGAHVSIDQRLAQDSDAPFKHLYLGVQSNVDGASGDKFISYPSAGVSVTPTDDPTQAFSILFGDHEPTETVDARKVSIIDAVLDDMHALRDRLGSVEQSKLDLHLESLREVENRIKNVDDRLGCDDPSVAPIDLGSLNDPAMFPAILRAQIDLMVLAMSCGLTSVGTLQCSHHTSELLMSRFAGTALYDPGFDMRSHQASHYGASHDPSKKEYSAFYAQRIYWVEQFAYLLEALAAHPEGDGTMLDHSLVVLCSEVCDGNTHLHDNMPFVVAGRGAGSISPGRLIDRPGARHADLYIALAHAMGSPIASFGDNSTGPLTGVLS